MPPVKARAYACGEAWSVLVAHTGGRSALVQGSAGFVKGALAGQQADVVYLGIGQLGIQSDDYIRTYWAETVDRRRRTSGRPDPLGRLLPRPRPPAPRTAAMGDDLDATMRVFEALASAAGRAADFPTVFRREDPWA